MFRAHVEKVKVREEFLKIYETANANIKLLESQLPPAQKVEVKKESTFVTHTELGYIGTSGNTNTETFNIDTKIMKEFEALGGKAIMKEVRMTFSRNGKSLSMDILMYLPKSNEKVPVFLGLNFKGNHTILDDPEISLTNSWIANDKKFHM